MTTIYETVTVETEDVTVSLIVWNRFHQAMPGTVEAIYDYNRDLADLGPVLPIGTTLSIPIEAPREPQVLEPLKLW